MNRRDVIVKSLQAAGLLMLPAFRSGAEALTKPYEILSKGLNLSVASAGTGNPLRFPPVFTNGSTMTLAQSNFEVWPGQQTSIIGINNSYPGPTVKINKGQTLTVNFQNNLTEDATIHWHGLITPELMDGHPKDAVPPGMSKTYTFPVLNRAGTYFYHSHAHMITAKHVFKGFAGFFIVDDPLEPTYGLPTGNYDIPLCIQDHRIADIPNFTYNPLTEDIHYGFLGDTVLVNGTPDAYFEVSKTMYRFRILNGSNARVYKIALSDNSPFHIIGTDGGLKDTPGQVTSFMLSPGERVEILIDFSSYSIGQNVILKTLPYSWQGMSTYKQGVELNILRFDIVNNNSSGGVVPVSMTPIEYYNPNEVTFVRNFSLTIFGSGTNVHRINGLYFDMNRIDWETPLNALEEWKIFNQTSDFHPMHAHGVLWQVLARNNNYNLAPNDKGWKDTVLVNGGETVRVLVKFTDYKGIYLFHCHNLEHEDDGMMLNFKV
ncbi:MAG TPA: multicopper oxidase domain-containing protein, partial [Ignavibacteria bacterium]|nr:multicopper oxidase domain-containing protein [Ignavibacteria bacterium]